MVYFSSFYTVIIVSTECCSHHWIMQNGHIEDEVCTKPWSRLYCWPLHHSNPESSVNELGAAIMDCLNKRDPKLISLIWSTPVSTVTPMTHIEPMASDAQTVCSYCHYFPHDTAIKLEIQDLNVQEGKMLLIILKSVRNA